MRTSKTYSGVGNINFGQIQDTPAVLLHSNDSAQTSYIALGALSELIVQEPGEGFKRLHNYAEQQKDWLFGFFSYDLKNELESLSSAHDDAKQFPALHFFQPKWVGKWKGGELELFYHPEKHAEAQADQLVEALKAPLNSSQHNSSIVNFVPVVSKDTYLTAVEKLREHIKLGDIYEVNYCIEFLAKQAKVDPFSVFRQLNELTLAPHACFYRFNDLHLMCGSPERFLKKQGDEVISQPIKGTMRRSQNPVEDNQLKDKLFHDPKERAENIMITDLVRNDLAKTAQKASVHVRELHEVYSFKTVHQLISTVVAKARKNAHWTEIVKGAFPMGSMTGAPKVRAMKLIEQYESSKRGIYSGAVGYVDPDHNFDFNVVIRSLFFNAKTAVLSFQVGSAITFASDPEYEFQECMLKAEAMKAAIQNAQ